MKVKLTTKGQVLGKWTHFTTVVVSGRGLSWGGGGINLLRHDW